MPDPMTQDQLLRILSPCFHAAFIDICRHRVYVGESIFYAAGLTVNQDHISSCDWGFVILLDRRYLRVTISEGYGPSYFTTKLGKQKINRQWVMTDLSKKDSFSATLAVDVVFGRELATQCTLLLVGNLTTMRPNTLTLSQLCSSGIA